MSDTFLLFAEPSFMEGMARVLDLGNTLTEYNESPTPREADYNAIKSDWTMIGQDIYTAVEEIKNEINEQKEPESSHTK